MPYQKLTTRQWQRFSKQISFSKQTVEQLSKLYIIIHEKVKSSIKKSVINPHSNFSQQSKHHIEFIKNVLQKINDTKNDQYLIEVQQDLLRKYQKTLLGLLNQIQIMLKVQQSKINLDLDALKGIKPQKRSEYDLKNELLRSQNRILRAKSGNKKIMSSSKKQVKQHTLQNSQFKEATLFFPTSIDTKQKVSSQLKNEQVFLKALQQKQKIVQNHIKNTVQKSQKGHGISFQKKYRQNNLSMYLRQRKQLSELMFNQQAYNKIITQRQTQASTGKQSNGQQFLSTFNSSQRRNYKIDQLNNKLFPEFKIKTKFLKPAVKSNIANLIKQIKSQLIKYYYQTNIQTLKDANNIDEIRSKQKRNYTPIYGKNKSHSSTSKKFNSIDTDKNYQKGLYFQKKSAKTSRGWMENGQNIKRSNSLRQISKVTTYSPTKTKSFLRTSSKPFYQTDKWNQIVKKKYQNQVLAKLNLAKI